LIGQAGEQVRGIYEADYRDFNRETYTRGRETFDATYGAFKRLLLGVWRRDEIALGKKSDEIALGKKSDEIALGKRSDEIARRVGGGLT